MKGEQVTDLDMQGAEGLKNDIEKVAAQIRAEKEAGKTKADLQPLIDELLSLKSSWQDLTGSQPLQPSQPAGCLQP